MFGQFRTRVAIRFTRNNLNRMTDGTFPSGVSHKIGLRSISLLQSNPDSADNSY